MPKPPSNGSLPGLGTRAFGPQDTPAMNQFLRICPCILGVSLLTLGLSPVAVLGQPADPGTPFPRILRTLPAGATIGATNVITLYGNDLEAPKEVLTTHPGIKAKVIPDEAQKKDPKAAPTPNPKIELIIDSSVPVGMHGIRLINSWGTSNITLLPVHRLAQGIEKEPNNDITEATPIPWKSWMTGTISSGTDVDFFAVDAPANSPMVIFCQVEAIRSGTQPRIELIHPAGKPVRMNHNHRGDDALICYKTSVAGKYLVRVSELAYNRGSEGAQYQLYIGPGPWIESATPLAVAKSKSQSMTFTGYGLDPAKSSQNPGGESLSVVTQPAQYKSLPYFGRPERIPVGGYFSLEPVFTVGPPVEPILVESTDLFPIGEKEPNNTPDTAQEVPFGADITARIDKPGDVDYFRFTGKKGQKIEADLLPMQGGRFQQGHLRILPLSGNKQPVASTEDDGKLGYPKFFQRGLDVSLEYTLPADGQFAVAVASRVSTSIYGSNTDYRLRIQESKPSIKIYAMSPLVQNPGDIQIAKGGSGAVLIYLQRTNGFAGEVKIVPEKLPPGVKAEPITLQPGIQSANLVLTVEDTAPEGQAPLRLIAETSLGKVQPIFLTMRTAVPSAAITLPYLSVEGEMMISVRGQTPFVLKGSVDKPAIKLGDKGEFKVDLVRKSPDKTVIAVQGLESPGNLLGNSPQNINADKTEVKLPVTVPDGTPLGTYLLTVRGQSPIPYSKDPAAKQKPPANTVTWSNTVAVEVMPKELGTIQTTQSGAPLKPGTTGHLAVKITRREGFVGEVKVSVLEKGDGKIKIASGTIPAGKDSLVLNVEVAADVPPGAKTNLSLQAEGAWKGKFALNQKIPLNLNIVK